MVVIERWVRYLGVSDENPEVILIVIAELLHGRCLESGRVQGACSCISTRERGAWMHVSSYLLMLAMSLQVMPE